MNEKIRELAEQAGPNTEEELNDDRTNIYVIDVEKFAELIVKECYKNCKEQLLDSTIANEHKLSYNDGVADCAIGLLQHFGVEL